MKQKLPLPLTALFGMVRYPTADNRLPAPVTVVRIVLALFLVAFQVPAAAQAPAPAWQSARAVAVATAAVAGNNPEVTATTVDAAGNILLAGNFRNSVLLGGTTLTSTGGQDLFVAKFNAASSQFTWAQRAGGTALERAIALAVSGSNVYVTGYFGGGTAGFGTTTLSNAGANTGGYDVFVAKLTDLGSTSSFTWAQRAGGKGNDGATALAVSGPNVYVASNFDSPTASFGATPLNSAGSYDMFVAKLIDAGSTCGFAWAQQAGGTGYETTYALAVRTSSVYVAGYFGNATSSFGTTVLSNPNATPLGYLATLTDPTLLTATVAGRTPAPTPLFPNPAHHTATLRLPAGTVSAPLTLTDAMGRAGRDYPAPTGAEATLDVRDLPAGFYLLRGAGPAQRLIVE